MQYVGGKAKSGTAARIVAAIVADGAPTEMWWEPFVGGGSVMEQAAPVFGRCAGSDAHPDLIAMWQAVTEGWRPPEVTREMYTQLRHAEPSALRGFVGFGASFGGKWFGGWGASRGREAWRASARTVARQAEVFQRYGVGFFPAVFGTCYPPSGTTVYCDPPYQGVTGYKKGLDRQTFYETVVMWAADSHVYVSEYALPDWVPSVEVWSRAKRVTLGSDTNRRIAVERLWRILPAWP